MQAGTGHNRWKALAAWLDERLALDSIREFIAHKKVPVHSGTIWYTFGGITLFLFVIQVITGILLLVYYRPTPQDAFESVQFIMTGRILRVADPVHSQLVRQPDDPFRIHPHVQCGFSACLPAATGIRVVQWDRPAGALVGIRVQRLPAAVEHHLVFCDQGGHGYSGYHSMARPGVDSLPARRLHRGRCDTDTLLRISRGAFAWPDDSVPASASRSDSEVRDQRAAMDRGRIPLSEREGTRDSFLPGFPAARTHRMVWGAGRAGGAGRPVSLGLRRESQCLCFRTRRHPARVVFSGAVLHPQVDTGARPASGRRVRRPGGFWTAGVGMDLPPAVGGEPEWIPAQKAGRGSGSDASGLSLHVLLLRLLAMRYALILLLAGTALAAKDSCLTCHSGLPGELQQPAAAFASSVHSQEGFTCADCHGGDANSDDPTVAMSASHGFIGVPPRTAIPKLCARCHSDPNFMRKYNPRERVDQYSEYLTSVHGQRLRTGDTAVATCIDCHSVHDIRPVRDPLAPVYPLRVPATCAHCHANAAHMAKYSIPTNQYAEYLKSAHWEELSKGGDLSAPTCATCHGNHGAKPPRGLFRRGGLRHVPCAGGTTVRNQPAPGGLRRHEPGDVRGLPQQPRRVTDQRPDALRQRCGVRPVPHCRLRGRQGCGRRWLE